MVEYTHKVASLDETSDQDLVRRAYMDAMYATIADKAHMRILGPYNINELYDLMQLFVVQVPSRGRRVFTSGGGGVDRAPQNWGFRKRAQLTGTINQLL